MSQNVPLSGKSEYIDAARRHLCQVLGFDFVFIDLVRGHEILNLNSFGEGEAESEARKFVDSLVDEHKQPLTIANTMVAQKVKQTHRAQIGRVFGSKSGPEVASEGLPYTIVPISEKTSAGKSQVKGLLRVLSFDSSREITEEDISTLRLMAEHLGTLIPSSAQPDQAGDEKAVDASRPNAEHVLIVHSNRPIRRRFSRILTATYNVLESENTDKALEVMEKNRVDVILLDSDAQPTSGFSFCSAVKDSQQWKHVPVIIVAPESNPQARVEGINVGADDCLSDSCFDAELVARVRSALRHRQSERELAVQLQLLEDYASRLEQMTEKLSSDKQSEIAKAQENKQLRWQAEQLRNQDNLLHRISNTIRQSFDIKKNLSETLEDLAGWFNLDCCFIVMPSEEEPEDVIRCEYFTDPDYSAQQFDSDLRTLEIFRHTCSMSTTLMANDVTTLRDLEPFRHEILSRRHILSLFYVPITYEQKLIGLFAGYRCQSEARWGPDNKLFLGSVADQIASGVINARLYARVQRQATTDGLTGLFNHRTGQEKLGEQLKVAERYQRNISVLMLDVDRFKSINDTYGHPAGDSVLKTVARVVRENCRDVDIPVRYGGEEFLLVLPEVNQEGAVVVAERIRKALSQQVVQHENIDIRVTASIGVAAFPEDAQQQKQLLDLADKSLYLSKRLGRNQVHTASDLMFEEAKPPEPELAEAHMEEIQPGEELHIHKFVAPTVSAAAVDQEELVPEVVEMVKALACALYSKSDYNKTHHLETARLSELLAKVMGLSQQQVEQIRVAGLLHDVGTLSLPSELLNKEGKFTEEERKLVNQHPVLGAQLLRPIRALKDICVILENHHERWDGTGYPRGLVGEEIPLPARIVSVVDSYHAMISDRPYRKAMTQEQAISHLRNLAGKQFDPFLVDIFVAVLANMKENE